jgi:hypothetical protein
MAEPAQHFGGGCFGRGRKIVDADLRADQRRHLAVARGRLIRQIGNVDRQQIHRRTSDDRTAAAGNDG